MFQVRVRLISVFVAVLALTALAGVAPAWADQVRVTAMETDAAGRALGIDDPTPRFSWALKSKRSGIAQTAFRVRVASRRELLRQGAADVWDSGTLRSADPFADYAGRALASRTRYFSVRIKTSSARWSGWSRPGSFETALMSSGDEQAKWISGPERIVTRLTPGQGAADDAQIRASGEFCRPTQWPTEDDPPLMSRLTPNNEGECRQLRPAPMLRKSFTLAKPVARARAYSSGLGYNDLQVNGASPSGRLLDPVFTDYSKTVRYTTQDVTRLLHRGENVVASELGAGKFDNSARTWDWGWHEAEWRATPRLWLQLNVTYTDGTHDVIVSDDSWKVSVDGPTRYDDYYLGETYDARRAMTGWDEPRFDDSAWSAARVVGSPAGVLRAQNTEPSRIVAVREPGTVTTPAPGVQVYDVGQNLTGWATIRVNAPAGTPIQVYYNERLTPDGRVTDAGKNFLVGGQLQTDFYVADGSGDEVWAPRFTYKGFQYLQISGPNGAPLPSNVSVDVESIEEVRTDLRRTSTFETGNDLINRIHHNALWAIQNNVQSGVITDTPVLEKNPWTGDAQLTSGSASTLFDTRRLYTKLFQDMLDEQTPQGEVPLLSPTNVNYGYVGKPAFKPPECCGATPPWDAFWFIIPWEDYQRFGDVRGLRMTYPAMQKYLDEWIPRWTDKDGDPYAYTLTAGLGDWDPPEGTETIISLSATAYYAHFAQIAADVARTLGKGDDAARYDALFDHIRTDFNAKYLSADGIYRETPTSPFTQSAQILPLAFGLVPERLRAPLAAKLAGDIIGNRGGNEYVGILGARYILPVLSRYGYADVAYTVATQTDYPSYGYWIEQLGWTSLGEYWEATSRSIDHHMFGSIVQWMYEDLVGIRPLEPGYRKIEFRPSIPAGLDHARATYHSVRGTVAAAWRQAASGLRLDVTVPANATGVVYVPASDARAVRVSSDCHSRAPCAKPAGVEGDRLIYEIGSGSYHFRIRHR